MSCSVLYLSYDGMTDPLGQSQVLPYILGLSKKGYLFHLISFEKPDRYVKLKEDIQAFCDKNGITWHPRIYTKKPPLLSTLYDVQRMKQLANQLHRIHNFGIIHCRSYLSALVGIGMQKRFNIKFLFDMRGFWADERVDGKIWNLKNPIFKLVYTFFKRKERKFFLEADHVISLTYAGKEEIISWKGLEHLNDKIEVIPCCADLMLFDPKQVDTKKRESYAEELAISPTDFVLGYVGSIGTWYMLDEMLGYFRYQLSLKPNSIFLFVTGESPSTILSKASELGIEEKSIRVISVLHKEVATCISLFSASIFFIKPTFSKKASSPTKQGELMAMGIPIICNAGVGDTAKVVNQYQAGYAINNFETSDFESIDLLFPDFNKSNCQNGAKEFYSLDQGVARYQTVYSKLISARE
ncbi:MAG: glycosyltransferase [Crocinitomicaceae bacterium]